MGEGPRIGEQKEFMQPLRRFKKSLLIFPFKLPYFAVPFVYWKECVWSSFLFLGSTQMLEGLTAAETCSGEEKTL